MTDHEVKSTTDERLDPIVERAAALLRRPEPVRPAWRDELLASVAPPARSRRTTMRAWLPVGIAAIICAAVAGGVERLSARDGGGQVRFSVSAPSAKRVSLVGDFNGWNPAAVPMRRGGGSSDVWIVNVRLQPGRHVFAFSVDGALRADSAAPRAVEDDFGVPGSVVVVPGRGSD
jgi:Carbohydrate-binding module 48 (Isoamylase N-terminal domain)